MDVARCIGIAGAGKTTDAIEVIEKVRRAGFGLQQIGFISMTRVARDEAAQRASDAFGVTLDDLRRSGWFRTAHSVCHRMLQIEKGQMLADQKDDRKWIEEVVGDVMMGGRMDDDAMSEQFKGFSPPAVALRLWDLARSLLKPYLEVFERAQEFGSLPVRQPLEYDDALNYVQKYESAKARDGRLDFTDLLLRYAGMMATVNGCDRIDDGGEIPQVPVWIIDEHQDASLLLDMAQRRMTQNAVWVYLYGDGDQAIYSFAGASAKNFLSWPAQKERRLLKSWRCPRAILEHGRAILQLTDGWNSPEWEPKSEGGSVDVVGSSSWVGEVDANSPTLVLSRTNEQAGKMSAALSRAGVPWKYYKGNGGLVRPNAVKAWKIVESLKADESITAEDWIAFLSECPSGTEKGSCDLIERGTKSRYKKTIDLGDTSISLHTISEYGATGKLVEMICTGAWVELIDGADKVRDAIKSHGAELTENPRVLVATIHGSKGAQAENVFLHAGMPFPVQKAIAEDEEALREERRLYYVGSTRASDRLFLVKDERGQNFKDAFVDL